MRERLRLLQGLKPSAVRTERRAHANVLVIGETQVVLDSDDDAEWVAACVAFTGVALDELDGLEAQVKALGADALAKIEAQWKQAEEMVEKLIAKLEETERLLRIETHEKGIAKARAKRLALALLKKHAPVGAIATAIAEGDE